MSSVAERYPFIGINWGSSAFRAYLIGEDGRALDEVSTASGIVGLDRGGIIRALADLAARWPHVATIYASGMIGSNVGWAQIPYAEAPAGPADLRGGAQTCMIGAVAVTIVPGVACRRDDGAPDVMRGEEIELLGLAALGGGSGLVALPGTHTKWVRLEQGRIGAFVTSMSGEIYDRLAEQGLLASIVEGDACDGDVFRRGVAEGRAGRLSLSAALFGARARVMRGDLVKADAASYVRGLLIGADIADAIAVHGPIVGLRVPLIGNAALGALYLAALDTVAATGEIVESRSACLAGFRALHEARDD